MQSSNVDMDRAASAKRGHQVRRTAVIGAGSMGAGIAATLANAGIPVDLLDIHGGDDRPNASAERGLQRQVSIGAFAQPENAALVHPRNIEDDFGCLAQADWIVEAIVENAEIKRQLYRRIDDVRRPDAIVSSNTSTIPRSELVSGSSVAFRVDFREELTRDFH